MPKRRKELNLTELNIVFFIIHIKYCFISPVYLKIVHVSKESSYAMVINFFSSRHFHHHCLLSVIGLQKNAEKIT